ncbi:unnamed protein product [Brassica napus]|uniref:(rape) hypothetical protein n=1 Tax=Brassica napus TaxID=3708 RepID=A0A816KC02_BRANA|nr:unnamed protein product [Brassica napus]
MSGSKNSVRKWKVLDHVDSDDVLFAFAPKRQHSCSGLLMLTTVKRPPSHHLCDSAQSEFYTARVSSIDSFQRFNHFG